MHAIFLLCIASYIRLVVDSVYNVSTPSMKNIYKTPSVDVFADVMLAQFYSFFLCDCVIVVWHAWQVNEI